MKVYIVTRHHQEDGLDSFKTAAFTSLAKARKFMHESFRASVECFKNEGYDINDEEDLYSEADRAWITLSYNERDERSFNITECELDEDNFSAPALLD